jgi:hypothetical protein
VNISTSGADRVPDDVAREPVETVDVNDPHEHVLSDHLRDQAALEGRSDPFGPEMDR